MKNGEHLKVTGGELIRRADDWDGKEWHATITLEATDVPPGQHERAGEGVGRSAHVALKRAVDDALA